MLNFKDVGNNFVWKQNYCLKTVCNWYINVIGSVGIGSDVLVIQCGSKLGMHSW